MAYLLATFTNSDTGTSGDVFSDIHSLISSTWFRRCSRSLFFPSKSIIKKMKWVGEAQMKKFLSINKDEPFTSRWLTPKGFWLKIKLVKVWLPLVDQVGIEPTTFAL